LAAGLALPLKILPKRANLKSLSAEDPTRQQESNPRQAQNDDWAQNDIKPERQASQLGENTLHHKGAGPCACDKKHAHYCLLAAPLARTHIVHNRCM